MAENDKLSNDQPENNQDDQDNLDVDQTESGTNPEEEISKTFSQTIDEPESSIPESDPVLDEPEPPATESKSASTEAVTEKPAKDHTVRNIIIGLIVLLLLICCCISFFAMSLFASGVLDPLLDPLNLNL